MQLLWCAGDGEGGPLPHHHVRHSLARGLRRCAAASDAGVIPASVWTSHSSVIVGKHSTEPRMRTPLTLKPHSSYARMTVVLPVTIYTSQRRRRATHPHAWMNVVSSHTGSDPKRMGPARSTPAFAINTRKHDDTPARGTHRGQVEVARMKRESTVASTRRQRNVRRHSAPALRQHEPRERQTGWSYVWHMVRPPLVCSSATCRDLTASLAVVRCAVTADTRVETKGQHRRVVEEPRWAAAAAVQALLSVPRARSSRCSVRVARACGACDCSSI
jgi:hypothetical protein